MHATRRQWDVADYDRMLQAGILNEDDRVELLDGEIVEMSPSGSRHAACVKRLNAFLVEHLGSSAIVGVQDPIYLSTYSEPQPDISICHPRPDFYAVSHPTPADLFLLVEVADSSLLFDREEKLPLYARAGIPEIWLVDLIHDQLNVYTEPKDASYQAHQQFNRGETVSSAVRAMLRLSVDSILG